MRRILATALLTALLVACSGHVVSNNDTSRTNAALSPQDVLGTLVGTYGPIAGVRVKIGPTIAESDARGEFVFRDVPATYSLVLVDPKPLPPLAPGFPTSTGQASIFLNLTTRRPRIDFGAGRALVPVKLHVDFPAPQVVDTRYVLFYALSSGQVASPERPPDSGPLDTSFNAFEGAEVKLWAIAYQVAAPSSAPNKFLGYAQTTLSVPASLALQWGPTLEPIDSVSVVASVEAAPEQTVREAYPMLRFDGALYWAMLPIGGQPPGPGSLLFPTVPGAQSAVNFAGYDNGRPGSAGGGETTALAPVTNGSAHATLGRPPLISEPLDGASVGLDTKFVWQGESGLCAVSIVVDNGPSLMLTTRESSASIPDLSGLGIVWPQNGVGRWFVRCRRPLEGAIDDAYMLRGEINELGFTTRSVIPNLTTR
jgi:hypothetical protein